MSEWQPAETAPKNESIDIWIVNEDGEGRVILNAKREDDFWAAIGWYSYDDWSDYSDHESIVTHWRKRVAGPDIGDVKLLFSERRQRIIAKQRDEAEAKERAELATLKAKYE